MAERYPYDRERPRSIRGQEPQWADGRSYSSDREYGDRSYGWPAPGFEGRDAMTDYGRREMVDRDYNGSWQGPRANEFGPHGYGGPYGRQRYGAREWSSTEGWRAPGPHAGRGPRGYQRSDDRIREEVNDRLTADGFVDATDIETTVANGEVTLTGYVDSRAAKRAAEDIAEDIYGVRDVHNQLRVRARAGDDGVGRTSVLGLTEAQSRTLHRRPAATAAGTGRSRAR
jgi:hypothetical protein